MDRYGGGSRLLQSLSKLHTVAVTQIPAPAELGRDRHAWQGLHHRLHDASRQLRVLHQCRAVAVVDDLTHGTAHVDIQNIRPGVFHGDLGGLRHTDGVAAEDLHSGGMFSGKLGQQGKGLFVMVAQSLGGDQLRNGVACSQLGTDLPESGIRHPCHRSQR